MENKEDKKIEEKVEDTKVEETKQEENKPEVSITDLEKLYKVIEKQNEKIELLSKTKQGQQVSPNNQKTAPVEKEKEQRVPTIQKTEEPKVNKNVDAINGVYTG